jgi:DNA-directed RNA polymerase specialized sigma24 family protein
MSITPRGGHPRNSRNNQSPNRIDRWSDLLFLFRLTGDNEYFAEILEGTADEIEQHAAFICRKYELGRDYADAPVNGASLRLLRAAPCFDCKKPLLPYFKVIVTNCGLDRVRKERCRHAESLSAADYGGDGDAKRRGIELPSPG